MSTADKLAECCNRRYGTDVFASAVSALRPGGVALFEAYARGQLGRGTGGPPDADLLAAPN